MKNNKKGFTLVELVIVVAVMAVLVAVAIPTVSAITQTAKDTVADTNARTIESVIKLAEAEASKNSNGVTTVTEQQVWNALNSAKLGIEEGAFHYDTATGTVIKGSGTASATAYNITFAKTSPNLTVAGDASVTSAG